MWVMANKMARQELLRRRARSSRLADIKDIQSRLRIRTHQKSTLSLHSLRKVVETASPRTNNQLLVSETGSTYEPKELALHPLTFRIAATSHASGRLCPDLQSQPSVPHGYCPNSLFSWTDVFPPMKHVSSRTLSSSKYTVQRLQSIAKS
jgi:hypothetical protein